MKAHEILILIGVFFLAYKGTGKVMGSIRGIRNNNLTNIKYSDANKWQGQTGKDDKGFSVFSDPVYSIRATFKIFNSYKNRGINTLEKVISAFAPATENKTDNYISFVANKSGVHPKAVLTDADYVKIMPWIVKMETGSLPDQTLIIQAKALV